MYVLGLNPGYSQNDDAWHKKKYFRTAILANLNHKIGEFPFYFLDSKLADSPGAGWWRRKCKWLLEEFGPEHIAKNIFMVELFPYHSHKYKSVPRKISADGLVPSSGCSAHLVKKAMQENKAIVAMRAFKGWCELVPELETYPNLFRLNSPQNVALSPNNVQRYDNLVSILNQT